MVRLQRDDGAVAYLNGVEVFRSNMATGEVNHTTLAMLAQDDGMAVYAGPVDHNLLIAGNNVLAVEVHQASVSNADAVFGATLELTENPPAPAAPVFFLGNPDNRLCFFHIPSPIFPTVTRMLASMAAMVIRR